MPHSVPSGLEQTRRHTPLCFNRIAAYDHQAASCREYSFPAIEPPTLVAFRPCSVHCGLYRAVTSPASSH
jgi:hypothetical protein